MYSRKLITAPALEPITVTAAKEHCRVDHDEHNEVLFPRLIAAAREHVENICGRKLITQTWDLYPENFPCGDCIYLPFGQLQSISLFEWTDTAGATSSWTVSGGNLVEASTARAHINLIEEPGEIELAYAQSWPTATLKTVNPIKIRFVCGYGASGASVPAPLISAMLLLIDHWYRNTSGVTVGQTSIVVSAPLLMGVEALIENYRLRD